jgi:hypothetical protein
MPADEGSCNERERSRNTAPLGNADLHEYPRCPQPERDNDRRRCRNPTRVAACEKAYGDVAEPVQAEAEEGVLVEGGAALRALAPHGGGGYHEPDCGDAGGDVARREASLSYRRGHRNPVRESPRQRA